VAGESPTARCPSEYSVSVAQCPARRRPGTSSRGLVSSFRVIHPPRIAFIGFAIPLRRWPFPRPWGFPGADAGRQRVNATTPHLSSTSAVLQSVSRPNLAALAARGGVQGSSSHGLCVPSAHSGGEGPLLAGRAKARYVPPPGFGHPPGGFLPLPPRRACFVPTALLGFIPSKRSPLARWRSRFREGRTRMPLATVRSPAGRTERTGAPRTDFQALAPAKSPWLPTGD